MSNSLKRKLREMIIETIEQKFWKENHIIREVYELNKEYNNDKILWEIKEDSQDTLFPYTQESAWEDLCALEEVEGSYIDAIIYLHL